MAFWDDWDFTLPDWANPTEWFSNTEIDGKVVGITFGLWAVLVLCLFKFMLFGSMDNITLFGIPWSIMKYIYAIVLLPITYGIVWVIDNKF